MTATGIVRKVDELGRIVLPIELRKTMGIQDKDPLEISVDEGCILLTKYQPSCVFCGETADVILFRGKNVCPACRRALALLSPPEHRRALTFVWARLAFCQKTLYHGTNRQQEL